MFASSANLTTVQMKVGIAVAHSCTFKASHLFTDFAKESTGFANQGWAIGTYIEFVSLILAMSAGMIGFPESCLS